MPEHRKLFPFLPRDATPWYMLWSCVCPSVCPSVTTHMSEFYNKSSAVAEIGDRLAIIDNGPKSGTVGGVWHSGSATTSPSYVMLI